MIAEMFRAMEQRNEARHVEMTAQIQKLMNTHVDLQQLKFNLEYIFGPEGSFISTTKDVKRHNRYEIGVNALLALGALIGSSTLVQWGKKLLARAQ